MTGTRSRGDAARPQETGVHCLVDRDCPGTPTGRRPADLGSPEITLVAVTGKKPVILTETVWALAQESPPIIPDSILALTTSVGEDLLRRELCLASREFGGKSVWEALRESLAGRGHQVDNRLVLEVRAIAGRRSGQSPAPALADIRNPSDIADAADFILEQVRGRTASWRSQVIASIAGGRKTLGALMYGGFSLVARSIDRLTHVMVNAPYDQELSPGFYYPEQPTQVLRLPDGSEVRAADARIELVDIPFVVLRNAVPGLADHEPTFTRLVARYNERFTRQGHRTGIVVDFTRETIQVEGVTRRFHKHELIVLEFWLRLYEAGITPQDHAEAAELFRGYHGLPADEAVAEPHNLARVRALPSSKVPVPPSAWLKSVGKDYVRKPLSTLRVWMRKTVRIELPPLGRVLENFELRIKS
jgi:CRISPR-associated protein (TIGR02584 family)